MPETKTTRSPLPFPDDDTLLMAMYGSAFSLTTLRTAHVDKVLDSCVSEQKDILEKIQHDIAFRLLTESKDFIISETEIPANVHIDISETILLLRRYLRYNLAIDLLKEQRKKIIQYGGFIGAGECSIVKQTKGTSPEDWRRAATRYREKFIGGRP